MKKAIDAVLAKPWAIMPEALEVIEAVAQREHEYAGNLEALEAKLGRPLGNTMTATVRDGVAIIPVEGPLFTRANLMTDISGATSYDRLALDFNAAQDDPTISGIMLVINSPGGQVDGASEFAQMVSTASKPVRSYVTGSNASAAYWIASASDKIVGADTSIHGSIGAQIGVRMSEAKAGEKSYRWVSSVSPKKNASPDTEDGNKMMQAIVDGIGAVFAETVAKNRATTLENVLQSYGAGEVFIAAEALKRGMIDDIDTFEGALSSFVEELKTMDYSQLTVASLTEHRADLVAQIAEQATAGVEQVDQDAIRAQAINDERARCAAIDAIAVPGAEQIVARAKAEGMTPEQAAVEMLAAVRQGVLAAQSKPAAHGYITNLAAAEQNLAAPIAGDGSTGEQEMTMEQLAALAVEQARKFGIEV